ncbi:MAG: MarR family transcriptional regulator [Clostridia bacterium]|nr:MarR family transcriptional regulator [Clostridia bacterium]
MPDAHLASDTLLDSWLKLTSTLWNTRIVKSLTYNETHVMGILLRHTDSEPLTATDLIRKTRLLKSQMNKLLTTLENRGLITRSRSEIDKRLIHIHLTNPGKEAYLQEHKGVEEFLSVLVQRLGPERALAIANDLHDINDILDDIIPIPK